MANLHVFAQGVLVFQMIEPVESGNSLIGRYEIVNGGRFNQKIGFVTEGRPVMVLVGGRPGIIKKLPQGGTIQIDLCDAK